MPNKMTKKQKEIAIERAKPLFDFLDSYDARLLGEFIAEKSLYQVIIHIYIINCYIVIATIGEAGWDIFLPAWKDNNAMDTLKGAEEFLGPRPGDGHLQGEDWKQFTEAK